MLRQKTWFNVIYDLELKLQVAHILIILWEMLVTHDISIK